MDVVAITACLAGMGTLSGGAAALLAQLRGPGRSGRARAYTQGAAALRRAKKRQLQMDEALREYEQCTAAIGSHDGRWALPAFTPSPAAGPAPGRGQARLDAVLLRLERAAQRLEREEGEMDKELDDDEMDQVRVQIAVDTDQHRDPHRGRQHEHTLDRTLDRSAERQQRAAALEHLVRPPERFTRLPHPLGLDDGDDEQDTAPERTGPTSLSALGFPVATHWPSRQQDEAEADPLDTSRPWPTHEDPAPPGRFETRPPGALSYEEVMKRYHLQALEAEEAALEQDPPEEPPVGRPRR